MLRAAGITLLIVSDCYNLVGYPGLPGGSGPKGLKGEPGICQACSSAKGPVGERGSPGAPGDVGYPGYPGNPGPNGPPGPSGYGEKGNRGDIGQTGDKGEYGDVGYPGPPGTPGDPGIIGVQGPPGPSAYVEVGQPGYPGTTGQQGRMGNPGRDGYPGIDGQRGQPGQKGHAGEQGSSSKSTDCLSGNFSKGQIVHCDSTAMSYVKTENGFGRIQIERILSFNSFKGSNKCNGKQIRLIALDTPVVGMLHGIAELDKRCLRASQAMKLSGRFRGFLSAKNQDINTILHPELRSKYPVCNSKKEMMFSSWDEMYSKRMNFANKRILTFTGRYLLDDPRWKNKMIWSGSTENGRRDQTRYCNDWKSANDYFVGAAVDLRRGTTTALPCSTPLGVLCVDVAASGP